MNFTQEVVAEINKTIGGKTVSRVTLAENGNLLQIFEDGTFLEIPANPIMGQSDRLHPIDACWLPYIGNNRNPFHGNINGCFSSISFSRHLGKPLSYSLWIDLRACMGVTGLCIYHPDDDQWTIGWGPGHCIINLTHQNLVSDIQWVPHWRKE